MQSLHYTKKLNFYKLQENIFYSVLNCPTRYEFLILKDSWNRTAAAAVAIIQMLWCIFTVGCVFRVYIGPRCFQDC